MTVSVAFTPRVVIWKLTVVAPPGTVTLVGTFASALLLMRFTVIPWLGAAGLMVTVPVTEEPPAVEVGDVARLARPKFDPGRTQTPLPCVPASNVVELFIYANSSTDTLAGRSLDTDQL